MYKVFLAFSFLSSSLFFSCSGSHTNSKPSKSEITWDSSLVSGKVIDSLPCPDFPKLSYALYLPLRYNASKRYPCIYFFDSHANGAFPLKRYKNLADQFGFVLIGSNNSRNGMAWQDVNESVIEMMEDSRRRIHIDSLLIFTSGFSGGAKVASSVAIFNGGIAGVIACAGGMPPVEQEIQTRFDYFGIVGEQDFNLTGLDILHEKLGLYGFNQQLITFNGKHTWADSADFRTALLWMQVQAMRHNNLPKNDTLIQLLKQDYDRRLDAASTTNDLVKERTLLLGITKTIDTLLNLDTYRKQLISLTGNPFLSSAVAAKVQLQHNEISLQDTLSKQFSEKDLNWWSRQITELNLNIRTSAKPDEANMYSRVLNYLGLVGYMTTSKAIKQGDLVQAANFVKIFKMADPKNPDCFYLEALCDLKAGKQNEALKALETAADLGYAEPYLIVNNPDWAALQNNSKFQEIEARIQRKHSQS